MPKVDRPAGLPEPYWTSTDGRYVVYHADCLKVLPLLMNRLAILADPPYRMFNNTNSKRFTGGNNPLLHRGAGRDDWSEVVGDNAPFDPSPWLRFKKVVLWGANHFAQRLPVGTTLVWIKRADHLFGSFLSDAEIGWMKGGCGVYCFRKQFPPPSRMAEGGGKCLHPNQKPVSLLEWCLTRMRLSSETVFDPYMGSGSAGIASVRAGLRFIGIEIDEHWCEVAVRRISSELYLRDRKAGKIREQDQPERMEF